MKHGKRECGGLLWDGLPASPHPPTHPALPHAVLASCGGPEHMNCWLPRSCTRLRHRGQRSPRPSAEDLILALLSPAPEQGFLGVCPTPPCVVSDFCSRGSLGDVLKTARQSPSHAAALSWVTRLNMVRAAWLPAA